MHSSIPFANHDASYGYLCDNLHDQPVPQPPASLRHAQIQSNQTSEDSKGEIATATRNTITRWKDLRKGLGSRHLLDKAPFSLWNDLSEDFREASDPEIAWIQATYHAAVLTFEWPNLIIHTDIPPVPLPLTVGCVAARFVPASHVWKSRIVKNGLSNPRIPDPVAFRIRKWTEPSDEQVQEITVKLMELANIQAINFTGAFIHVELKHDGRTYKRHSLPGRLGGISTLYYVGSKDFWSDMSDHALTRLNDPSDELYAGLGGDRSNYLRDGLRILQPGVCLGSLPTVTADTNLDSCTCTTAGVRLRNSVGNIVVTAANSGFPDSDEVFHPTTIAGEKIGDIYERWQAQDVAMVKLRPSIQFSNGDYFQATTPRRLLKLSQTAYGQWCSADGMSCGIVFLTREGRRVVNPEYRTDARATTNVNIPGLTFTQEGLYSTFGALGGAVSQGICGAPIVEEDTSSEQKDGGGVCGFVRMVSAAVAACPGLDEIIDRSWELY
ncbi:hypothetical protein MMC27_004508 [Xylographa pallens]|nr:hypothetical protein [Xylographa pallens]